jgi:hypothetical protein
MLARCWPDMLARYGHSDSDLVHSAIHSPRPIGPSTWGIERSPSTASLCPPHRLCFRPSLPRLRCFARWGAGQRWCSHPVVCSSGRPGARDCYLPGPVRLATHPWAGQCSRGALAAASWLGGLMARWLAGWVGGWVGGWLAGWMDRWVGGWVTDWGGWLAGWVAGWLGGCGRKESLPCTIPCMHPAAKQAAGAGTAARWFALAGGGDGQMAPRGAAAEDVYALRDRNCGKHKACHFRMLTLCICAQ